MNQALTPCVEAKDVIIQRNRQTLPKKINNTTRFNEGQVLQHQMLLRSCKQQDYRQQGVLGSSLPLLTGLL